MSSHSPSALDLDLESVACQPEYLVLDRVRKAEYNVVLILYGKNASMRMIPTDILLVARYFRSQLDGLLILSISFLWYTNREGICCFLD